MPRVHQAPDPTLPGDRDTSIFLAGGITNCPDWQGEIIPLFKSKSLLVFNPRRSFMPENAKEQIVWEFRRLQMIKNILFWFPKETLCPITLYELGAAAQHFWKTLFVGTHPEYQRKLDVETQLGLLRPEIRIVSSLEQLAEQVNALK